MTTLTVGDAAYRLDVRPMAIYELVDQEKSSENKPPKPWSRTHVNAMTKRLTRLFKWAVSVEIFPGKNWLEDCGTKPYLCKKFDDEGPL